MARKTSAAETRRRMDRLRALALDPAKQREFAREIIATETDIFALEAALKALGDNLTSAERPVLIGRYQTFDADGKRRDPGGYARAHLVSALRKVATHKDAELFERAVVTDEPTLQGGTVVLNAAGLLALADVQPERATLHAIRLLARGGSPESPEPALSAARLLSAGDEVLPLYMFLLHAPPRSHGDVIAEALRGLRTMPADLLGPLLHRFDSHPDDIVGLGVCDLLVEHAPDPAMEAFAREMLRAPQRYEVFHYLVTAMVASRRADLIALVTEAVSTETDRIKLTSLSEALDLIPGDQAAASAAAAAREKAAQSPDFVRREPVRRFPREGEDDEPDD